MNNNPQVYNPTKFDKMRLLPSRFRAWLLSETPPNNFKCSRRFASTTGGASFCEEYYICFDNDAHDIAIFGIEDDAHKKQVHLFSIAAEDFRSLAAWYFGQWAYGEWFGLRRWLWFKWLFWHLTNAQPNNGIQPTVDSPTETIINPGG